jgi:hypothetical protein
VAGFEIVGQWDEVNGGRWDEIDGIRWNGTPRVDLQQGARPGVLAFRAGNRQSA